MPRLRPFSTAPLASTLVAAGLAALLAGCLTVSAPPPALDRDADGWEARHDCDDADPTRHPDADEACNGVDDDCDGAVDESLPLFYRDADGDGWGDDDATVRACEAPDGYAELPGDCDDADAGVHPAAEELCDYVDQDCDGAVDEDATVRWYADADGDGWGDDLRSVSGCEQPAGFVDRGEDCDDRDPAFHPGAAEVDCAGGPDYNCDGSVGAADADNDGFTACEDCDDADRWAHPGADETCNDRDDDCDGGEDEAAVDAPAWHRDADRDGYGAAADPIRACDAPDGHVADARDCDDADAAVNPAADEACDPDDVDEDCDGVADDLDTNPAGATSWWPDRDNDGHGAAGAAAVEACEAPDGYAAPDDDCDDAAATVHPAATEVCNDEDDDCDGTTDEGTPTALWYVDVDLDGYGDDATAVETCAPPTPDWVDLGGDCAPDDPTINPGAVETCDDVDEDCDGAADDGLECPGPPTGTPSGPP